MFSCNNVRIPPANGEIIKLPVWILPRICKGSASMEAAFYALIATGFDLSWRYKSSVSGSRISVTTGVEEPHQSLCGDDGNWLGNWLGTSALRDNQTRKLWFFLWFIVWLAGFKCGWISKSAVYITNHEKENPVSLQMDIHLDYPLVNVYIAIENCPVEIVSFPMNSMVIFQFVMYRKRLPEGLSRNLSVPLRQRISSLEAMSACPGSEWPLVLTLLAAWNLTSECQECPRFDWYPLVNVYITNWKMTIFHKSTISMAILNSYFDITRGYLSAETLRVSQLGPIHQKSETSFRFVQN